MVLVNLRAHPRDVFNCDESGINLGSQPLKSLAFNLALTNRWVESSSSHHYVMHKAHHGLQIRRADVHRECTGWDTVQL